MQILLNILLFALICVLIACAVGIIGYIALRYADWQDTQEDYDIDNQQ